MSSLLTLKFMPGTKGSTTKLTEQRPTIEKVVNQFAAQISWPVTLKWDVALLQLLFNLIQTFITLTNFWPIFPFYAHRNAKKTKVFWHLQGVSYGDIGQKWISSIIVNFEHAMCVRFVRACVRFTSVPNYSPLERGRAWGLKFLIQNWSSWLYKLDVFPTI